MPLIAHQNVLTAFDHIPRAAAVFVPITQTVRLQIVNKDRLAALDRDPRVRSAAVGMDAAICDAQRRAVVDFDIGRTGFCRSDAFVRATGPVVCIRGNQGLVAETGLFGHSPASTISRSERGQAQWR